MHDNHYDDDARPVAAPTAEALHERRPDFRRAVAAHAYHEARHSEALGRIAGLRIWLNEHDREWMDAHDDGPYVRRPDGTLDPLEVVRQIKRRLAKAAAAERGA